MEIFAGVLATLALLAPGPPECAPLSKDVAASRSTGTEDLSSAQQLELSAQVLCLQNTEVALSDELKSAGFKLRILDEKDVLARLRQAKEKVATHPESIHGLFPDGVPSWMGIPYFPPLAGSVRIVVEIPSEMKDYFRPVDWIRPGDRMVKSNEPLGSLKLIVACPDLMGSTTQAPSDKDFAVRSDLSMAQVAWEASSCPLVIVFHDNLAQQMEHGGLSKNCLHGRTPDGTCFRTLIRAATYDASTKLGGGQSFMDRMNAVDEAVSYKEMTYFEGEESKKQIQLQRGRLIIEYALTRPGASDLPSQARAAGWRFEH